MTDVITAVRAGDTAALRSLLEADASRAAERDEGGLSAVLLARYHGRTEELDLLLGAGVELDVFEAAAVGAHDRLASLIDGDPALLAARSVDGFTPLHLASFFGHEACVRVLLGAGADPSHVATNPMTVTPLHSAAAGGHTAVVELLLSAGADPDARQSGGWTALHSAAQNGDVATARALLGRGADRAAENDGGRTPLDLAVEAGKDDVAQLLR